MKTQFNIAFDQSAPLNTHPMAAWLADKKPVGSQLDLIINWLESIGFDSKLHQLHPDQLKVCEYVVESWAGAWVSDNTPMDLGELFTSLPGEHQQGGYYVQGLDYKQNYIPTEKLLKLIDANFEFKPVIMDLNPTNFYFKVLNGKLFLQYQQIIGGRKVCNLI